MNQIDLRRFDLNLLVVLDEAQRLLQVNATGQKSEIVAEAEMGAMVRDR